MDKRGFEEVIRAIQEATDATNRVLDAANLQRNPGPPTRMSAEQKTSVLLTLIWAVVILGAFWMFTGLFR